MLSPFLIWKILSQPQNEVPESLKQNELRGEDKGLEIGFGMGPGSKMTGS